MTPRITKIRIYMKDRNGGTIIRELPLTVLLQNNVGTVTITYDVQLGTVALREPNTNNNN